MGNWLDFKKVFWMLLGLCSINNKCQCQVAKHHFHTFDCIHERTNNSAFCQHFYTFTKTPVAIFQMDGHLAWTLSRVFWHQTTVTDIVAITMLSYLFPIHTIYLSQGVKVETFGRQNERNISYVRLAHTSLFGLCFMSVFNKIKLLTL